jgi:hypothetical protein
LLALYLSSFQVNKASETERRKEKNVWEEYGFKKQNLT